MVAANTLEITALLDELHAPSTPQVKLRGARPTSLFDRFQHFKVLTDGDTTASAVLVLAEAIRGGPEACTEADRLLSLADVADRLNVSVSTVRNLTSAGKLKAERIGTRRGRLRIRPDELERFQVEAQREASAAPKGQATLAELRELVRPTVARRRRRGALLASDRS